MDDPETERLFEETLTTAQLNDMLNKKIRPVHWVDGTVSYFRVQKIIDVLLEEKKPFDPHLDVAISVLSGGKAQIRNQTHRDFVRDISAKMNDLEGQTDEDLQQPVECLVPGCFPIGPECESLGISGDILFNSQKSFPQPINPDDITNRVMFELSEYVARVKESYESVVGWIKKIMGWGDDYDVTPDLVEEWFTTLMRDSKKKKKSSMFTAQKYLLEKFQFPGLKQNVTNNGKENISESPQSPDASEMVVNSDKVKGSENNVEFSGDEGEDNDESMDVSDSHEKNPSEKEAAIKKTMPVTFVSAPKDSALDPSSEKSDPPKEEDDTHENDDKDANDENGEKDTGDDNDKVRDDKSNEGERPDSPPPRTASARSAAKAARGKITKPDPPSRSTQSRKMAPATVEKKQTLPISSARNTRSRIPPPKKAPAKVKASPKKTPQKVRTPPASSSQKSKKLETSEESSEDEEDEEDGDDSSIEEGEVTSSRSGKRLNHNKIRKDISEATKLFTSVSKTVTTLKKEMKIAIDYLESETRNIIKNLQKAEKMLGDALKMVGLDGGRGGGREEEEEEEEEEDEDEEDDDGDDDDDDESNEEEESEEEKPPVRQTRNSSQTKKITVQVKPGVGSKLKKPLVKVTRLQPNRGGTVRTTPSRNTRSTSTPANRSKTSPRVAKSPATVPKPPGKVTKSPARVTKVPVKNTKTPVKVSRQSARRSVSPRASHSANSEANNVPDFDQQKLFSSRLSVCLTRISEDVVKQALDNEAGEDNEELSDASAEQEQMSPVQRTTRRASKRRPEPEMESDDDEPMDDDNRSDKEDYSGDDEQDSPEREDVSTRGPLRKKNSPKKTADLRGASSRSSRTSRKEHLDEAAEGDYSTSKRSTRSSPRNSRENSRSARSPRQARSSKRGLDEIEDTNADSDKAETRSSRRSWRAGAKSPDDIDDKGSEIEGPYSGTDEEYDDHAKRKTAPSAFAALAAGMTSFGELRGATPSSKERAKKRSLNDFVKLLNDPKRRKTDTSKRRSPRRTDDDDQTRDINSEEDSLGGREQEKEVDDFLENMTEEELEKYKEDDAKPQDIDALDGAICDEQEDVGEEISLEKQPKDNPLKENGELNQTEPGVDNVKENVPEDQQPQSNHKVDSAANKDNSEGNKKDLEGEAEKEDDFPGDKIVGKRIRHRCSMGKHGLYKWYEGVVLHKSTASELLKLDEEQFSHLNNLYTFYTVKYDDFDDLQAKALAFDWDRENLKVFY